MDNKKKILSLFDGASCAQLALRKIGVRCDYFASEIEEYAMKITNKNFPDTHQIGDILQFFENPNDIQNSKLINLDRLPRDIFLLIGGSPCQDLSAANNNGQGLIGERSGLFWAYVRLLDHIKPRYFVLENVRPRFEKDQTAMTNALGVAPIMLDSSLVSAQRRRRLYWTNIPNITRPKIVPSRIYPNNRIGLVIADILEPDAKRRIVEVAKDRFIKTSYGVRWNGYKKGTQPQGMSAQATSEKSFSLVASNTHTKANIIQNGYQEHCDLREDAKHSAVQASATQQNSQIVIDYDSVTNRATLVSNKSPTIKANRPDGKIVIDHNSQQNRAFQTEGKFGTLPASRTSSKTNIVFDDVRIEQLTWTEIERLMGMPDFYTDLGEDNRVEPRGRAIGNGFQVDIAAHLLSFMSGNPEPLPRDFRLMEQISLF